MKQIGTFLRKLFWFSLLPVTLLTWVEWRLATYPSTFNIKAKYIQENKSSVEVLILGSSHNQMAINPEWLHSFNAASLAIAGQDILLDSCLLGRYLPEMPELEFCIFELSYHSLEHTNEKTYDRNNLYLRFHNINNFQRATNFADRSIFFSSPKRYIRFLDPFHTPTPLNKYGFATELSRFEQDQNRFEAMGYNEQKIRSTADNLLIRRHQYEDRDAYLKNCRIMEHMIQMCQQKGIIPIVVIPPVFDTYLHSMIPAKKERRELFLLRLKELYPTIVIDNSESDSLYQVTDFKNDDHLGPEGALKYSGHIDQLLLREKSRSIQSVQGHR